MAKLSAEDQARVDATRATNAATTQAGGFARSSGIASSGGIKSSGGIGRAREGPDRTNTDRVNPAEPAGNNQPASDLAAQVAQFRRQLANIRIIRGASADHVDVTDTGITIKLKS